jgi:peptidyl-prolyl cis-trans isomerase NIMA-interacting 1
LYETRVTIETSQREVSSCIKSELESLVNAVAALAPPKPLPEGWIVKESRSQPGYRYYFNHLTGECTWYPPFTADEEGDNQPDGTENGQALLSSAPDDDSRLKPTRKRSLDHVNDNSNNRGSASERPAVVIPDAPTGTTGEPETVRPSDEANNKDSKKRHKRAKPEQVRVLHILKKHKGARRPSSWRVPNITISKDEAIEELKGLLELLHEVAADPKELRATMEELARTESDCSSAKRGGDLGFFGPKKMQPAFEEASFKLDIGQLSDIVDTSSGVHVILRIG